MSFLSFLVKRFLTGTVARGVTTAAARRFKLSPGMSNILFLALMELLARALEKPAPAGRFPGKRR